MPIPRLFTDNVRERTVRNRKQNLKQKIKLSIITIYLTIIHLLCTQNAFCCNVFHKIRVAVEG